MPFGSEGGEGSAVLSRHTRLSARVDALKQSTGGTRGPASPPSSPRLQRMFLTQDDAPGRNGVLLCLPVALTRSQVVYAWPELSVSMWVMCPWDMITVVVMWLMYYAYGVVLQLIAVV